MYAALASACATRSSESWEKRLEYGRAPLDDEADEYGGSAPEPWSAGRSVARRVSARFVCRYACKAGKVDASGTVSGTTGRVSADPLPEGRAAGSDGSNVQCAARTRECVG